MQQLSVVLIAVWFDVQIERQLREFLVASILDVLLHEPVVLPPGDTFSAYGCLLGPQCDLVRVLVMKAKPFQQSLFDRLVKDQEAVDPHAPAASDEEARKVAINVDGLPVSAVAG